MSKRCSFIKCLRGLLALGTVAGAVYWFLLRPRQLQPEASQQTASGYRRMPAFVWQVLSRLNRRVAVVQSQRPQLNRIVLLLTTIGRKSGLPRVTPLQYEAVAGQFYVASARGAQADWFRNIQANPNVQLQVAGQSYTALAEPVTDPGRIADFLALRLERHPRMIRMMLLAHGLPLKPERPNLERLAADLALVVITPRPAE